MVPLVLSLALASPQAPITRGPRLYDGQAVTVEIPNPSLLVDPEWAAEIGLRPEQRPMRMGTVYAPNSSNQMAAQLRRIVRDMDPKQRRRLTELSIQAAGHQALLHPSVFRQVGLDAEQRQRLSEVMSGTKRPVNASAQAWHDVRLSTENRLAIVAERVSRERKYRQETRDRDLERELAVQSVLTKEQMRRYLALRGAPPKRIRFPAYDSLRASLALNEDVLAQIGVSADVRKAISRDAMEFQQALLRARFTGTRPPRRPFLNRLTEPQSRRLTEVTYQVMGVRALVESPMILQLRLRPQQVHRIRMEFDERTLDFSESWQRHTILTGRNDSRPYQLASRGTPRGDARNDSSGRASLRQELERSVRSVLTPEQRRVWNAAMGRKIADPLPYAQKYGFH